MTPDEIAKILDATEDSRSFCGYCGDTFCDYCGPLQGNRQCEICGAWDVDGGCQRPDWCQSMRAKLAAEHTTTGDE